MLAVDNRAVDDAASQAIKQITALILNNAVTVSLSGGI
jgi:hypothetical protein